MNALAIVIFSIFSCFLIIIQNQNSNNQLNKIFYIISCVVFSYFIGTRTLEVPDTEAYTDFYNNTNAYSFDDFYDSTFETGFQILTKFLKIITAGNVSYYFMAICLINFTLLYYSLINFSNRKGFFLIIGLNIYLAFFGLFYNGIVLRQGLALNLICYAVSLLNLSNETQSKLNKKKVIISLILAFFMHLSSVIGIVVWFLFKKLKGKSNKYYTIILVLSVLIYFLKLGLIFLSIFTAFLDFLFSFFHGTQFAKYLFYQDLLEDVTFEVSFKILFFYFVALLILLLHFKDNLLKQNILFRIYMIGVILVSIFGFIGQISRILDYFLIFSVFVLYKEFIRIEKFDSRLLFLFLVLGAQFFFVFRIINGV